jgi:hypothetical protein
VLQAGRGLLPDPRRQELAVPVHVDEGFALLPVLQLIWDTEEHG